MASAIVTGATGKYILNHLRPYDGHRPSCGLTWTHVGIQLGYRLTWVGILGREIVDRLGQNPEQWKTVYAMSRSNRDKYPPNVKHGFVDLTRPADKIAKDLEGVEAEYVFFAAYVQKDSEKENWDANGMSYPPWRQTR
ncbi:putative NAD dependent epimerase/dehydratase [Colletotrichum sublineola]|uniref:Putative NAD dependent epimerase/dehydratase n=1 Tax=Colletotrichum sublineola TaxID=1173701 RepID=A0A066XND4_COLSU|nr:putative NAD dependent epimerase/dehydratase [Colletotrichum sublineola]